jgi:hypothetical protein
MTPCNRHPPAVIKECSEGWPAFAIFISACGGLTVVSVGATHSSSPTLTVMSESGAAHLKFEPESVMVTLPPVGQLTSPAPACAGKEICCLNGTDAGNGRWKKEGTGWHEVASLASAKVMLTRSGAEVTTKTSVVMQREAGWLQLLLPLGTLTLTRYPTSSTIESRAASVSWHCSPEREVVSSRLTCGNRIELLTIR